MADISKIKSRLAALLRKARDAGASDAEVAEALNAAQKMMDKYGVTEDDLETVTQEDYRTAEFGKPAGRKNFDPILRYCGPAVCQMTGVLGVYKKSPQGGETIEFYGLDADVEYATWLIHSLQLFMNDQWDSYKRWDMKNGLSRQQLMAEKIGFIRGFCDGVNRRMAGMMDNGGNTKTETGTALVVKKKDLAKRHYEATHGPVGGGVNLSGSGTGSMSGAAAGSMAAQSASLGRGVGTNAIGITDQR